MQTAFEGYCKEFATLAQSWNDLIKTSPVAAAPMTVPECR